MIIILASSLLFLPLTFSTNNINHNALAQEPSQYCDENAPVSESVSEYKRCWDYVRDVQQYLWCVRAYEEENRYFEEASQLFDHDFGPPVVISDICLPPEPLQLNESNSPPIADAGSDQRSSSQLPIEPGDAVILRGIGFDPDSNDILTYSWSQAAGPKVNLTTPNTETSGFEVPEINKEMQLEFELMVIDNKGASGADTISVIVTPAKKFEIIVSAFIPADYIQGPPQSRCASLKQPLYLDGDDRSFDPNSGNYRTKQTVTVVTGLDSDGIDDGTSSRNPQNLIGESKSYAPNAVADGKIDESDDDDVLGDCYLLQDRAYASAENMHVNVQKISENQVKVSLKGAAALPLVTGAPAIDWDFTITIDTTGGKTHFILTGEHDGFPAHEVYINKNPIYRYNPGSPPFTWEHIQCLFPPAEVPVNVSANL